MNLKSLRTKTNLTQKELAEKMGTTQQTVARWESGKTPLNVDQIRDLCIILNCSPKQLLGDLRDQPDSKQGPYIFPSLGAPYGTLKLSLRMGEEREYPIDNASREDLLVQLSEAFTERRDQSDALWLALWTLDNRYLIVNPRHLRKAELISDDVEAMPSFENEKVYQALEHSPMGDLDPSVVDACNALIESQGLDEVQALVSNFCATLDDRSEHRANLTEDVAHALWELTTSGLSGERKFFVELNDEGFEHTIFINQDAIALLEIPASKFRGLMGQQSKGAARGPVS